MPDSEDPIQMLHNIELMMNEKCTELDYIQEKPPPTEDKNDSQKPQHDKWIAALREEEKVRKEKRTSDVKTANDQAEKTKKL